MKKDILTDARKTDLTLITSLGMSLEKGISGVRPGRENMKRYFTSKPSTDFLRDRGWVCGTHFCQVMTHVVLSLTATNNRGKVQKSIADNFVSRCQRNKFPTYIRFRFTED